MKDFIFKMPAKVRFGEGIHKQLGTILKDEMGFSKVFVATDKGIVATGIIDKVKEGLDKGGIAYEIYDELIPDPTIEVVDEAADVLRQSGADVVLAVGGGSPIDTAKAMCMLQTHEGSVRDYLFGGSKQVTRETMPLVCIPTTAGTGSEMTAASVITNNQDKTKVSVTHENLIPRMAFIDPELQMGMPPFITATTGMDALTHAIESYVSLNAEPISDAMGIAAIRMISENIRLATADGSNKFARTNMAIASTIAGVAFMNGGLGVVHGIAQTIGAVAHVAHGVANSLLLPYCMERNVVGNLEKFRNIAIAMGENIDGLSEREAAQAAVDAVFQLAEDLKVPMKLKDVGVTREMFPEIIEGTMEYRLLGVNPCKLKPSDIEEILENAFE
ncbi:MAG: iron-containing alcohol dehydrogenase [Clostridiales bacterium]|nr:iron-containing alcohol dehydrogenase [Clostridiales bacterium]